MDFQLYKSVMHGLIDLLGARWYFASKVLTPYCYTLGKKLGSHWQGSLNLGVLVSGPGTGERVIQGATGLPSALGSSQRWCYHF